MTSRPATFCPDCGTRLVERRIDGRERRYCEGCEQVVWHNPAPCAGVAVVGDAGVLLTRRDIAPGRGEWAVPGGHLEAAEPAPVAAARELREETGVRVDPDDLAILDCFHADHGNGKTIVSVGYAVRAEACTGEATAGGEVQAVGWFTPETFDDGERVMHVNHGSRFQAAWDWFQE